MVVKVGIIKAGNIGTSPVIDLLLDERADRDDVDVRVIGSGAKMDKKRLDETVDILLNFHPDMIVFITPNPNVKQLREAREEIVTAGIPTLVVGDRPGEKGINVIKKQKLGYILIRADPMIGARREFLDSTEMAIFNADVIKVLAITGVFRVVTRLMDEMIESIKKNEKIELPEIILTADLAVEEAGFKNDYAKSKAIAAFNIAEKVSSLNIPGCFERNDPSEYIPLVTAGHEMMSIAARLAEEAREVEKYGDSLLRTPHRKNGEIAVKTALLDDLKH